MPNKLDTCISISRVLVLCGVIAACSTVEPRAATPGAKVNDIAERYLNWALDKAPETAYFSAISIDRHDGLYDNRPAAIAANQRQEDQFIAELNAIAPASLQGSAEWITASMLGQELRGNRDIRICRNELWNVNQMSGWHLSYPRLAELQPVETAEQQDQALRRWSKFASFVDQEIVNLKAGLELGYSSPKPVVRRVIEQINGLLEIPDEASPFNAPARHSDDAAFQAAMLAIVAEDIRPALERYRDFLSEEYLARARQELSITANPDGRECYEASLRYYTTLDSSGQAIYELGQATVADNRAEVIELGQKAYGVSDFKSAIDAAKNDSHDHFANREELLAFSRDAVLRAEQALPNWFGNVPDQAVAIVPFDERDEGTGRSAHYQAGSSERPAEYRIPLYQAEKQSRSNAEITAFHETWPGHHLQVASAQSVEGLHPVTQIIWFSGPGEGWARYSERLAEEMGLYETVNAPILRRAWPARGMVVDPGLHLFGWSREQAIEFMTESGRFPAGQADSLVDRIAILPGQLTAYDAGGLEILALRRDAETALGDAFDIREFHEQVLKNGTIPLGALRQQIEAWLLSSNVH